MNRSPPVASASSSDQPLKNGDQEQSQSSGAVKRSNATNVSIRGDKASIFVDWIKVSALLILV